MVPHHPMFHCYHFHILRKVNTLVSWASRKGWDKAKSCLKSTTCLKLLRRDQLPKTKIFPKLHSQTNLWTLSWSFPLNIALTTLKWKISVQRGTIIWIRTHIINREESFDCKSLKDRVINFKTVRNFCKSITTRYTENHKKAEQRT